MNRPAAPKDEPADIDDEEGADADDGSDENADSPARPIHDVSYIPNYPSKSTRSASFTIEGLEMTLCSSWMKQRILLSVFDRFTRW